MNMDDLLFFKGESLKKLLLVKDQPNEFLNFSSESKLFLKH